MRRTAPSQGHPTSSGAAACPVHGRSSSRSYTSYSSPSYSSPTPSRSSGGSGSSGGGGGSRSARPRWSPANSPVAYTPDEVTALDRYRGKVESAEPRAKSYDLFLCHAWDDRRETAIGLHNLLEAEDVSVWFSEKDIILGQPFMREIDKSLAKTRIGLVLITPAFLRRIENGGVSDEEIRSVSPLLGSRHGLNTGEDSMEDIAKKIAELIAV